MSRGKPIVFRPTERVRRIVEEEKVKTDGDVSKAVRQLIERAAEPGFKELYRRELQEVIKELQSALDRLDSK